MPRLIETTINMRGQALPVPELTLEAGCPGHFSLYAYDGTHEQFHSKFTSDLDLTRLPSGKFCTYHHGCQLAAVAMNILRRMGHRGLLGPNAPVRHSAKRPSINTVMQELICRGGRLI